MDITLSNAQVFVYLYPSKVKLAVKDTELDTKHEL